VRELAVGKSQYSIAKEVGLNQSSVCKWANKDDIRELVKQEQIRLLQVTPDAVQIYIDLIGEEIPKTDIKRRELQLKVCRDVLKSGGLLPTPIGSQTLINIVENKPILSDNVFNILHKLDEYKDFELPTDIST
jgi:predicted transcriptional regulator